MEQPRDERCATLVAMGRWSEKAPSERAARRGFGRAIDYDDAITMDTRRIAQLTDPLAALVSQHLLPTALTHYPRLSSEQFDLYAVIAYPSQGRAERAALFGLSADDLRDWAAVRDDPDFGEDYTSANCRHGEQIERQWADFPVCTEVQRIAWLKKARASLARHVRNKALYGRG